MLGYIRYDYQELKIKDLRKYRDTYCYLCHRVGKDYGNLFRLGLSYDLILFILIFSLYEDENKGAAEEFRCPLNPAFKRVSAPFTLENYQFLAFVNALLISVKLKDNVNDRGKVTSRWLDQYVSRKIDKRTNQQYAEAERHISAAFLELFEMEEENQEADILLNKMGSIMILIKEEYFKLADIDSKPDLDKFADNLLSLIGQWIYFLDAVDDYFDDRKKGEFNLLSTLLQQAEVDTAKEFLNFTKIFRNSILSTIRLQVEGLKKNCRTGTAIDIIENICCYGTVKTFSSIEEKIRKKYPEDMVIRGAALA